GLAASAHQVHPRSQAYGVEKFAKAAGGNWGFPGSNLKVTQNALGYYFEQGSGPHKVLFVGDSHMEQYYPRIERVLAEHPDNTKAIVFVTMRACAPIHPIPGVTAPKCAALVENALTLSQHSGVDTVVFAAAWNRYDWLQFSEADTALRDLAD